ncbi:hypothetical protein [Amycolatopsis minnesotensis]|uniref:Uncharacterized protein n=1 Tax=Amycolatopsis minnesotensis TaxID=337894 RepID=A0ABP5C1K6_9PSEU
MRAETQSGIFAVEPVTKPPSVSTPVTSSASDTVNKEKEMASMWAALAAEAAVVFIVVGVGTAWFRARLKSTSPERVLVPSAE